MSGLDATVGVTVDEPCLQVAANDPGGEMPATITAAAADLDCWLWRRPALGPLRHSGQLSLIDQIETAISSGID